MSKKSQRLAGPLHALDTHDAVLQRGTRFTQRMTQGMSGYGADLVSTSRGALLTGDYGAFLKGTLRAASSMYLTAFDAWAGLLGGSVIAPQTGAAKLQFDPDSEMAGPVTVDLDRAPTTASPQSTDLTLGGDATNPTKIPKEYVRVRVDGNTLCVSIVNLMAIRKTLSYGDYEGEIALGGNTKITVTATYADDCSDSDSTSSEGDCVPCGCGSKSQPTVSVADLTNALEAAIRRVQSHPDAKDPQEQPSKSKPPPSKKSSKPPPA